MIGRVVSTKTKHTATILVENTATHPLYKKTFLRSKKYLVDDQLGVKEGDMVEITKSKPISKNKHWKIVKVLGKNLAAIAEQHLKEKAEEAIAEVMPEEKKESRVESQESSEEVKSKKSKLKSTIEKSKVKEGKDKSSP